MCRPTFKYVDLPRNRRFLPISYKRRFVTERVVPNMGRLRWVGHFSEILTFATVSRWSAGSCWFANGGCTTVGHFLELAMRDRMLQNCSVCALPCVQPHAWLFEQNSQAHGGDPDVCNSVSLAGWILLVREWWLHNGSVYKTCVRFAASMHGDWPHACTRTAA